MLLNLQLILWRLWKFVGYYLQSKTLYRVHSPALFQTIKTLFDHTRQYYAFEDIAFIRQQLLKSKEEIRYIDYGAGPGGVLKERERRLSVASIAEKSGSDEAQGELLFRAILHLEPKTILELGTSLGIGSAYLTTPNRNVRFVGIEGNPDSARITRYNLQKLGCVNAEVLEGTFDQNLPKALQILQKVDFVYIDGDHKYESTLRYFEQILPHLHEKSVLVLDDIYWTEGMLAAWHKIGQHPRVHATLDIWHMGFVFLDPAFQEKVHLKALPPLWKWWERYV